MKRNRFPAEQIIGILKGQGSSAKRLIEWINRSAERYIGR